jgi:hypothetical protein
VQVVFANQQGYSKIICESNCEELVWLWKRSEHRSWIAPIISEVEELCSSFESFDFCFIRRTANVVAHECVCVMRVDM